MWNWERPEWPQFTYDIGKLGSNEELFLRNAGEALGAFKHLSEEDRTYLKIQLVSEEALKTSKIEGEHLDRDSIQSSISRHFGLHADKRIVAPAEQGVANMMVDLYETYQKPLTMKKLNGWHEMLMSGNKRIEEVGKYRTGSEPMRIVSGKIHNPVVHYVAPPAESIRKEMDQFIKWFNASGSKNALPALTRSAIAHFYFESIHPYEDGNGRIGRAISELALAQSLGYPSLIALSYTIERERSEYYDQLAKFNTTTKITDWILYFGEVVLLAQSVTQRRIELVIKKSKIFQQWGNALNERQTKVINRLFRSGIDGFEGGLSAENYMTIAKTSATTATRDLTSLVEKGILRKTGRLKGTRYHLIA